MEDNIFELLQLKKHQNELATLILSNEKTEKYGLSLTEEDAKELIVCRDESLKKYQRVELGTSILDKLIYTFCDSSYINQDNYLETLERLQEIFYEYKNESEDNLTDEELLSFMREQFDGVCTGDTEYLEGTCLEIFSKAIRAGYEGYKETGGYGEYGQFDEVPRWDKEVYLDVLSELFW